MLFFAIQRPLLVEVVQLSQHSSQRQRRRPVVTGRTRIRLPFFVQQLLRGMVVVVGLLSLCSLRLLVHVVHGFHQRYPFAFTAKMHATAACSSPRSTSSSSLSLSGPFYVEISNMKHSNHFEHESSVADRHDDHAAANTLIISDNRTRDVTFLSPLLKYGYRKAVEEYEDGSSDEKPLLLYLPGFDGTFLAPFLQFPELGTIFEVQCMSISTADRSTFDELKETVVNHLLQENSNFEQRQQQRRLEQLEKQDKEKQKQQQQQQQSGGGGFFGLFGRPKSSATTISSTENTNSTSSSSNSSNSFFNLFGWWPSTNTTAANTTATTTVASTAGTATTTVSSSSSSNVNKGSSTSKKDMMVGPSRPIYLAGESFGGILACEIALELLARHQQPQQQRHVNLQGLALINPATCYDRSRLAVEAPLVAEQYHPILYPVALVTKVLPLFLDEYSISQLLLILQAKALPSVIDNAMREAYMGRVAFSLPFVLPYIDQSTLRWRVKEWLEVGCERMAVKLKDFQKYSCTTTAGSGSGSNNNNNNFRPLPILIVAGEKDSALPSIAEAERLSSILPKTFLHVVEGAGHSSTCGSRVDLAALFRATYPELRRPITKGKGRNDKRSSSKTTTTTSTTTSINSNRIAMKKVAAAGKNEYFGMEPRYDNSTTIGLSPLLYWNEEFYRKFRPRSSREAIDIATDNDKQDSSKD